MIIGDSVYDVSASYVALAIDHSRALYSFFHQKCNYGKLKRRNWRVAARLYRLPSMDFACRNKI